VRKAFARKRERGERGAVALEAALTFPILLLILLGIIEFTFLMRDHAVVVSDTRLGARIAATGANAGQGVCEAGPTAPPCVPSNVPALAQQAADSIQRAGSAMPVDQIQYLLVYKANSAGYPGADGNTTMPSSCSGYSSCVMFVWRPLQDAFRYSSGSWDPRTISACFPGTGANGLDRVGIQLVANHKNFTGLFGSTLTLDDHAVMNFEPLPAQYCAAGAHS
jgi:TadE-like protein